MLIVTHDPRVEDIITDRILWLEEGKIIDRRQDEHKWAKDPVCGMRVDEWRAIYHLEYDKKRFVFCSIPCLHRFETEPNKDLI